MTFPILPPFELGLVAAVLIGFGFGFVLERAGFGRANKLAAQFYGEDMTVFKVMFSAIVTAMLGVVLASALGLADFKALADHAVSGTYLVPMVAGGFLLGAGFIVSGYCPGTSFVAMASGKLDGLMTVLGVIVGQVLWAELEWRPGFATFHNAGDLGNFYLWELFHLSPRSGPYVVALAVTAMAVGCFVGAEKLERVLAGRSHPGAVPTPAGRPGRFVFAGLAVAAALGLVGLAAPTVAREGGRAPTGLAPLALARRVFDEPWKLRIVDLRPMEACSAKRIPGAECVPQDKLGTLGLADASPGRDLVLVGAAELPAMPEAAAAYPGRVYALEGGFAAWEAFALTPPAPPAPGAPASDLEAYRLRAGIQAAMTGMKAAPPPPVPAAAPGGPRKAGGGGCSG
ncbi:MULTISPECIES: YeeE/YedE thiosulfate transporter family protein [Anaeromyxobacter]|uniref:YeeE/YedE thiosulfate transporter family protein n=1 Tax=Anaeromyxobacter TaxID=161492 RepID=UPI001F59BF4A|nr:MULTISPECIES: YeeE/YedE thiosulfate transporter family protein [unclassified Anaeromyxobacter]